jgi:hypothetical protein
MRSLKKIRTILLSFKFIRKIDLFLRIGVSKFEPLKDIKYSSKKIFILYGGLGDCISWLNYNFNQNINNSLIFAIPSKYKEITVLLPHNKNIFFYNNFFSLIFNLRNKFKNHSFVFTSPVIELKIVH